MSYPADPTAPFWSPLGRIPRSSYILRSLVIVALVVGVLIAVGGPETESLAAWLVILALSVLSLFQGLKRGRDAGWPWWLTLVASVFFSGITWVVLMVWPSKRE
jgi:uncharacterized membrane protein YhaH (DUF805 family)